MNPTLVVDIADMKASNSGASLVTYALGSCLGVAVFSPEKQTGALLHLMLPDSRLDPKKAAEKPFMFADTGLLQTFQALKNMGCTRNDLIVKVAGGANIMDPNNTFNIGKRNYLALKKILWKFSIIIKGEDVGGSVSRNMTLNLATGGVSVRYSGNREETPI